DLANATDVDLVRAQLYSNDWIVRQARRILQERAAAGRDLSHCKGLLLKLFNGPYTVGQKLRALWSLVAIGGLDEPWLIEQLAHDDEHVRAWGVRLLVDRGEVSPPAVAALQELATREKSGLVQVYLASAM